MFKSITAAGLIVVMAIPAQATTRQFEFSVSSTDTDVLAQQYSEFYRDDLPDQPWSANVSLTIDSQDTTYTQDELVDYTIEFSDGITTAILNPLNSAGGLSFSGRGADLGTVSLDVTRVEPLTTRTQQVESFSLNGTTDPFVKVPLNLSFSSVTQDITGGYTSGFATTARLSSSDSIFTPIVPETETYTLSFGTTDFDVKSASKLDFPDSGSTDGAWQGEVTLVVQSFGGPVGDGVIDQSDILDFSIRFFDEDDQFEIKADDLPDFGFLGAIDGDLLTIDFLSALAPNTIEGQEALERSFSMLVGDGTGGRLDERQINAFGRFSSISTGLSLDGFQGRIKFEGPEFVAARVGVSAVPLPASGVLLLAGFGGVFAFGRRRRAAT